MVAPQFPVLMMLSDGAVAVPTTAPVTVPTTAPAASTPAGCAGGAGGNFGFAPFILIFVVFYFMLLRPQQKKQKEAQDWVKSLKKDDEVVTTGGVLGRITGLTETTVTLEVQEKVRLKVLRSHISGPAPSAKSPSPTPSK